MSMKTKIASIAALMVVSSSLLAHAATVENKDADAVTLTVTEDGVKDTIVVASGAKVDFCANGCFVTTPSGDRAALSGGENIQIVNGEAVVQ